MGSLVVQQVKAVALSLLRCGSLLWRSFSPWLGNFHMWQARPKPTKKFTGSLFNTVSTVLSIPATHTQPAVYCFLFFGFFLSIIWFISGHSRWSLNIAIEIKSHFINNLQLKILKVFLGLLFLLLFVCFLCFFWPCLWHAEFPRNWTELLQWLRPLQWQRRVLNPSGHMRTPKSVHF